MKTNANETGATAMKNITAISISAVGAAQNLASAIAGHGDDFAVTRGDLRTNTLRTGMPYTELKLLHPDGSWASATVTIEAPSTRYGGPSPAAVTHSSSPSTAGSIDYALATAELLTLAAQAALILNGWAVDGLLDENASPRVLS